MFLLATFAGRGPSENFAFGELWVIVGGGEQVEVLQPLHGGSSVFGERRFEAAVEVSGPTGRRTPAATTNRRDALIDRSVAGDAVARQNDVVRPGLEAGKRDLPGVEGMLSDEEVTPWYKDVSGDQDRLVGQADRKLVGGFGVVDGLEAESDPVDYFLAASTT